MFCQTSSVSSPNYFDAPSISNPKLMRPQIIWVLVKVTSALSKVFSYPGSISAGKEMNWLVYRHLNC